MRRWRLVDRRNAHQTGNVQAVRFAACLDEDISLLRKHAGLLCFCAGIDLHEEGRAAILPGNDLVTTQAIRHGRRHKLLSDEHSEHPV